MMAQSRAESTRDTYNYGQYINQFPPEYDKSNTGIRTDPQENFDEGKYKSNKNFLPFSYYLVW